MEKSLLNRLQEINKKNLVRFHYPGHKGRESGFPLEDVFAIDTTETYGTDNLLNAQEILKQSQENVAQAFGTLDSFYGVGGSTMALYAALFALTQEGQEVLVQRNSHKSIYQGALLGRRKLRTIDPVYDKKSGLLLGIDPKDLEDHLDKHPNISLLVLTNPSYYGVIQDLKELVSLAHRRNIPVLVDEAHGAHLALGSMRKYCAIEGEADIVVQSAHKSLGAMTQTALLHRNSHRVSREKIKEAIGLFTSTSPSYVFMVSIEGAVQEALAFKEQEDSFVEKVEAFKNAAADLGYEFFSPAKSPACIGYDYMKLFFSYPGYWGEDLAKALYERGVNVEMVDGKYVLGVLSQKTHTEDFQRALRAMASIEKGVKAPKMGIYTRYTWKRDREMYQAFFQKKTWIPLKEAKGKVSADFIYQYPPGIPLIIPGEVFTEEIIEGLKEARGLVGLKEDRVKVI